MGSHSVFISTCRLDPDKAHPGLQSVASITSSIQFQYDSSQLGVKRMSLEPLLGIIRCYRPLLYVLDTSIEYCRQGGDKTV